VNGAGDERTRDPLYPLRRLLRREKWYLGGGDRLIWAPPFPQWLDYPGLWDELHYFDQPLFPGFTWTLLSTDGRVHALRRSRWEWSPAGAVASLRPESFPLHGLTPMDGRPEGPPGEVSVREVLTLDPADRLACEVSVDADAAAWEGGLQLVAWTAQPDTAGLYVLADGRETRSGDFAAGPGGVLWTRTLLPERGTPLELRCRLRLDRAADSWAVQLSEGRQLQPHWGLTPWAGRWPEPMLPDTVRQAGNSPQGVHYAALQARLEGGATGVDRVTLFFEVLGETGAGATAGEYIDAPAETVRLLPAEQAPAEEGAEVTETLPPTGERPSPLLLRSVRAWARALAGVPELRATDPYLENAWWHRWYALHLLESRGGHGRRAHPAVGEGIASFRVPISFSGHAQMRDLRWRHDPAAARGTLLNFLDNQREDGCLPGRVYHHTDRRTDFYHADWGGALMALEEVHPDPAWRERVYPGLARYAAWLDGARDPEQCGLYDVRSHFETGQEYMSRYMAVSSEADTVGWVENLRLKGVDATVYAYRLKRALAWTARSLGRPKEAGAWEEGAERIAAAVRTLMWDPAQHWFSDVDPRTMARTGVKAATGFYPFLTDLAAGEHLPALWQHLLDPEQFWTPWPVPSTSQGDAWFDAEARWKGKRMNCPWNGRVWPMTASHVLEALARAARALDPALAPHAAYLLGRFVRLFFTGGDPARPSAYEHYHPFTGEASCYRGIDDYVHSWLPDLIVRLAVGLHPVRDWEAQGPAADLEVLPLETGIEHLACRDLPWRGHRLDVELEGERVRVSLDGRPYAEGSRERPLRIPVND
jgi:hypothetical protein